MAKKVFESHSLSEYIYEFSNQGYDEHREKQAQLCEELFTERSFDEVLPDFYMSYYDIWMRHDENPHIANYLQETYDEEELRVMALSVRWCRCCNRHRNYKTQPKPVVNGPQRRHVKCGCDCRRLYRVISEYGLA
jgi:hypothetical protein